MKKLYLVDVSAFYFRAFYAIRPLTAPSGLPVNAIYGFLAMITKLIKDERPDYVAFCYDRKEPSFRKALYDDYKANRSEMPEDLAKQIPYMRKVTDLLGIPALELESFEADDLIGTLTKKALEKNLEVVIVSGDKDFAQLVTDHVILYDTMKDTRLGPVGVEEKWGVRPDQFIDYLAIVGDTSDNIPGVRGIGEKGAQKLLKQFASLKDIYAHLDQVESKGVREKLIASQDQAFLSQKLVTIVCDAPIEVEIETLKQRGVHREGLRELLQELNFKSFEKNLLGTHDRPASDVPATSEASSVLAVSAPESPNEGTPSANQSNGKPHDSQNYEVTLANWSDLSETIRKQKEAFVFLWQGQLVIATADLQKYASLPELTYSDARSLLAQCELSGFDLKNLCHVLDLRHDKFQNDVMLMAYVIRGRDSSDLAELIKEFSKEHFQEELPDIIEDTRVLSLLRTMKTEYQKSLLALEQLRVYSDIEMPLLPVLLKMEQEGIKIDTQLLASESVDLAREIEDSRKEIIHLAGEEFNVASTKQLGHILFEKLGLPAAKKTKTGFSTDNDVLQNINHPIAPLILKFRELSKLKSTYVDAIPKLCGADERVHTTFNQALTNTGRLSSVNPNLQNIPIRTERGQRVRKAFVAEDGCSILSMDYSQIELRLLAHCSNDEGLIRAFQNDLDIHTATAAEIYGLALEDVNSDLRRRAKAVNFGIAYGQGAFGLAENLGISRKEAQEIIDRYFQKFARVRNYIEDTIRTAHEKGYVETLFGRRRYLPDLKSKNNAIKKFAERAAINAPMQGSAADLVKKAMIEVNRYGKLKMLLQVHDELVFEGPAEVLGAEAPQVKKIMEGVIPLKVPLKVHYAIGSNWDEAH